MPNQVFPLFICPNCDKYTIHMPRLTLDGRFMVDHELKVERLFCGMEVTVPVIYCEVNAVHLVEHFRYTRTVIRV